jgi:hypothetical protein
LFITVSSRFNISRQISSPSSFELLAVNNFDPNAIGCGIIFAEDISDLTLGKQIRQKVVALEG